MSLRFFRKFRVYSRNSAYDNGRLVAIQTKAPSIYHQIFITRFVLTSYRNNPSSKHFAHRDTSSLSNGEGLLPSTETTNEKFCLTYRYFDFSAICLTGCTLSTTKEGTNLEKTGNKSLIAHRFRFGGEWRNNELKSELCKRSDWRSTKLIFLDCRIN